MVTHLADSPKASSLRTRIQGVEERNGRSKTEEELVWQQRRAQVEAGQERSRKAPHRAAWRRQGQKEVDRDGGLLSALHPRLLSKRFDFG